MERSKFLSEPPARDEIEKGKAEKKISDQKT